MRNASLIFATGLLLLPCFYADSVAQSNSSFGSTVGSTGGGNSAFGSLTSNSTSNNSETSVTPFGGGLQNSVFGAGADQMLSAVGLTNLFSGGQQNNANRAGGGFGGGGFGGGGRGFTGNNNRNQRNAGSSRQIVIRTQLRVGFEYPRITLTRATAAVAKQLRTTGIQTVGPGLTVAMADSEGGTTVVLRGTVASEEDRQVAAQLVLLEPGIYQVRNELTVGSSSPAPAVLPLPAAAPSGLDSSG